MTKRKPTSGLVEFDTLIHRPYDDDDKLGELGDDVYFVPVTVKFVDGVLGDVLYSGKSIVRYIDDAERVFLQSVLVLPPKDRMDEQALSLLRYRLAADYLEHFVAEQGFRANGGYGAHEPESDDSRSWATAAFESDQLLYHLIEMFKRFGEGKNAADALRPFWVMMRKNMREWMNDYCGGEEMDKHDKRYAEVRAKFNELMDLLEEER
jgi:hypothetical protein